MQTTRYLPVVYQAPVRKANESSSVECIKPRLYRRCSEDSDFMARLICAFLISRFNEGKQAYNSKAKNETGRLVDVVV